VQAAVPSAAPLRGGHTAPRGKAPAADAFSDVTSEYDCDGDSWLQGGLDRPPSSADATSEAPGLLTSEAFDQVPWFDTKRVGPWQLDPHLWMSPEKWYPRLYNAYTVGDKEQLDPMFTAFTVNVHRYLMTQIAKPAYLKEKVDQDLTKIYKLITSRYASTAEDFATVKTMVTVWQSYRIHSKHGQEAARTWLNTFVRAQKEPLAWRKADALAGWSKRNAGTMDEAEKQVIKEKLVEEPGDLFPSSYDSPVVLDTSLDVSPLSPEQDLEPVGPQGKGQAGTGGRKQKVPPKPDPKAPKQPQVKPGGKKNKKGN